ncbi:hypothetical protein GTY54_22015, partial [Streptomyces sp. SID625]|nr:hypothetical protein [Streptomyces sp. SID625]
ADNAPAAPEARPAVAPSWIGLPAIQRALGPNPGGVADSGFGGRLPTWQNPSFTATVSHAVLDGRTSAVLGGGPAAHPVPASPVTGLERPAPALPSASAPGSSPVAQRAPAVPLRFLPPRTPGGTG